MTSLDETGASALIDSPPTSPLATDPQRDAERLALRAVTSPVVQRVAESVRRELWSDPVAATPDGAAYLDRAIRLWTLSQALREASTDPDRPAFVWAIDDAPRHWLGHYFPGASVGGVANPDNVYRDSLIDGAKQYRVRGHRHPDGPGTFSFELVRQMPDDTPLDPPDGKITADLGNQLGLLSTGDIEIDADGGFTITVGPEPADGRPNHLQTVPGRQLLLHRNTLSDWRQVPDTLTIERLGDEPDGPPIDVQQVIQRTAERLPDYVRFWTRFRRTFLGVPAPNDISEVFPRDGGWGFAAGGRYALAEDEGLVIVTRTGGSAYTGFQVTDPWMMLPDMRIHQGSLNSTQVTPDADGNITYVISPRDPGVANWIDTGGHTEGWYMLRWQDLSESLAGSELVQSVRVVRHADIADVLGPEVARVTPEQRRVAVEARAADYAHRIGQ